MKCRAIGGVIKEVGQDFVVDNAFQLSAALSYYAILALAPLLLVLVAALGVVVDPAAVQLELVAQMRALAGSAGGDLALMVLEPTQQASNSVLALMTGVIVLISAAGAVFVQLQDAMNVIWEVKPRPQLGLWSYLHKRILSLGIVLGLAFLLLVSLAVSAALAGLNQYLITKLPATVGFIELIHMLLALAVFTLLFAVLFKYLPDAVISWRDVWIGAFVTAVLFSIGKLLIGLYLGHSSVATTYGAAGSLVAVSVWVYYSSMIVLLGAEFTHVLTRRSGAAIRPEAHAVKTEDVA